MENVNVRRMHLIKKNQRNKNFISHKVFTIDEIITNKNIESRTQALPIIKFPKATDIICIATKK